jgi:hypothetical protein
VVGINGHIFGRLRSIFLRDPLARRRRSSGYFVLIRPSKRPAAWAGIRLHRNRIGRKKRSFRMDGIAQPEKGAQIPLEKPAWGASKVAHFE